MTNIPEPQHAIYAPSSSKRWTKCTASAFAIAKLPPQEEGEEAKKGTAAHTELERVLNGGTPDPAHPSARSVAMAVAYVAGLPKGQLWIESRVELSKDIWGRCDVAHFADGVLTILDLKDGFVDVDADTEQLKIYAAASILTHNVAAQWIRLVVVQPNSFQPAQPGQPHGYKQHLMTYDELFAFANDVVKIPAGELTFVAGQHCVYCPLFGRCPASQDLLLQLAPMLAHPAKAVPAELVAKFLAVRKPIEDFFKSVEKVATKAALSSGQAPEGMKIVQTVKHLAWRDETAARQVIYEAKGLDGLKPPTPAQAKEMGIDISTLADRPEGGPALAFASDRRAEWKAKDVATMFAGVVGAAPSK